VLGVSALIVFETIVHRRGAEVAETTQRKIEIRMLGESLIVVGSSVGA
jgi:hypothetical protein